MPKRKRKPSRKPSRRPVRRPSKPRAPKRTRASRRLPRSRIEPKPTPPIRERTIIRWRKGTKWVKEGTPKAERYEYLAHLSRTGKILRMVPVTTPHIVTKVLLPGTIEASHEVDWQISKSGNTMGLLKYHLQSSNVYTTAHKAKMIEISIRGKDTTEKTQRIKLTIEPTKMRDIGDLIVSRIITAMRDAGVRTAYTLEMLKAAKAAGPLARRLSYKKFATLEPLHDLEVIVTIHR